MRKVAPKNIQIKKNILGKHFQKLLVQERFNFLFSQKKISISGETCKISQNNLKSLQKNFENFPANAESLPSASTWKILGGNFARKKLFRFDWNAKFSAKGYVNNKGKHSLNHAAAREPWMKLERHDRTHSASFLCNLLNLILFSLPSWAVLSRNLSRPDLNGLVKIFHFYWWNKSTPNLSCEFLFAIKGELLRKKKKKDEGKEGKTFCVV